MNITSNHSDACLAAAMICAIENLRDSDNPDYKLANQSDNIAAIAEGYLWDGLTNCRCNGKKD